MPRKLKRAMPPSASGPLTRRSFFVAGAAGGLAPWAWAAEGSPPKRVAVITTIYRYLSHAQHIADRFLVGYPFEGRWQRPNLKVVSLFVDQKPDTDQSSERAKEFGFQVYPTIAEALRVGGQTLAVDAVLLIGEHGEYPNNKLGQKLYPRFEFFEQIVKVFEQDGAVAPVFNDKHLSYSFEKAKWMVDAAKRLHFPLLAGSSLPVTWRLPDLELPLGCEIEDALMVGYGGSDAMDYHALEAMQCMIERRKGGESGVKAVQMIEGAAVWRTGEEGRWSKELLSSALSRSDAPLGHTVTDGRPQDLVGSGEIQKLAKTPAAYFIEFNDGLRATLLMLNGAVRDFNFAARVKGMRGLQSTQFLLTPEPNVTYSACLVSGMDKMFSSGKAPYPAERTLIVCGILESCLRSKFQGQKRLETPHLNVRYQPPAQSQYCRL